MTTTRQQHQITRTGTTFSLIIVSLAVPILALSVLTVHLTSCQASSSPSSVTMRYSASDDASWAIHSNHLSSLLTSDKQSIYDNYIHQCNLAAASAAAMKQEQAQPDGQEKDPDFCTFHDDVRLRMNREQPRSVYNYTELGFAKIRTPPKLFQLVHDFYETNRDEFSVTEWTETINTYQNLWDIPSTLVRLEDERLHGGGEALKALVWEYAKPILEDWVGQELAPVSLYGVREYHRGSLLAPHVDRMPLVTSAIINIDQQGIDEPWPLEVYGHDGKATNITMEPGDMILYESHSVIHGRPFPLQGELYANIFLHFEPAAPDPSNYDPAEQGGLPPYIIPGSIWENQWRMDHPNGWLGDDHGNGGGEDDDRSAREAVFRGDVDLLRELGKENPDLLMKPDMNGWHPLHEAVRNGNIEIVRILLDHGANVNQETKYQENPLRISISEHGLSHEMTEFLLEMGAVDAGPDL